MDIKSLDGMYESNLANLGEAQLEALRRQIQGDIFSFIHQRILGKELQEKKVLYNQVTGILREHQLGPRVDPMEIFPYEIISKILFEISDPVLDGYIVRRPSDLLELTMVSKKWRGFILSESSLWTTIHLNNEYDNAFIVSLQVHLSRQLPLMIEVKLPFEQGDSLRSGLLESRERIDTIICNSYSPYIDTLGPKGAEFMGFLDNLGPLPNLRRLGNLYAPFAVALDVQRSIKQYANLEGIMNVPLTCQDLQVSKNKLKMETLVTTDDVESVLPIVENIHELRKVHFYPNYMRGRPENEGVEFSETKFSPDRPFYWTELSCDAFWGHFPISLLRRLPSLTQLQITIGSKTINTFASTIHHLQALESVTLTMNIDGSTIVPIAPSIPPNFNVRRLFVYLCHHEYGLLALSEASKQEEKAATIELLTKSILLLMPRSEKLSIYIDTGYCSVPLFSLEELFYGTELTLNFAYEGVGSLEHVPIPPSTRRLFLTCDRDVACSLSSLYLKTLWIFDRYLRKVLQFRSINSKLDLNNWPALETLYINGDAVAWSKSSLTSLRTVNIRTNRKGDRGNIGITSFVKDLATRPESYPSLEEIELEECPELDILLIMLERRNLLQSPDIKKIKRISFQSPCSLSVQRVISTILGGKWADRPSNKDLSLAGNAEILLDLTLPGCYMCHRGLRFCDAPVENSPKEDNMKDITEDLRAYPDDEDEILSSWSDRALLWESIDQNGAGRAMNCSWSKSTREDITADSF